MKKSWLLLLFLFACGINSCIDPLELDTASNASRLVVDGQITNEPGPYTVRLSISKPYASYADSWDAVVTGASVVVADDEGHEEQLTETKPGFYQTSPGGIQGQIGNTYTLRIKTKDGKAYTSVPELLMPVPAIDTIYTEVRRQQVLNTAGNEETAYIVEVYVDAREPGDTKNYYRWQWEGIYRISTQPWDYSEKVRGVRVPMPKDCCDVCWVTSLAGGVNVSDDRLMNGKSIKRRLITQIPVNARTFENKYYIEVAQTSISEAAFDYWSTLQAQTASIGSIQDPPPAIILGNISNVNDPEERVLGFFAAAAVSKKNIFVRREDLGVNPGPLVFPDDCRVLANSTTEKPAFW